MSKKSELFIDKEVEIVEKLEELTEVRTLADGEVREFIDRSEFYKAAKEIVKLFSMHFVSNNEVAERCCETCSYNILKQTNCIDCDNDLCNWRSDC